MSDLDIEDRSQGSLKCGDLVRVKPTADGGGSDREFTVRGVDDDCVMDELGTWFFASDVECV